MGVRKESSRGKGFTNEDTTYNHRETRPLSRARPVARSEEQGARSKEQGARMIFGTKLGKLATRNMAGNESWRTGDLHCEPLGSLPSRPLSRGFATPRRPPSCAYKARGGPSCVWRASRTSRPALCGNPPLLCGNLLLPLLWIGDLISMASTCCRPIADSRTIETPVLSMKLRSAELPEDREISDSDDDDLLFLGHILTSPKHVIDLTSDDDNDSESDDELPSVKQILASASPSLKQNPVLHSQKQAANLTYENGDESGGDDGTFPETVIGSSISSVLLSRPSLPKSPAYTVNNVTTPFTAATSGRKKHP